MASASSSIVINQPVDKVFDYITNVANHTAWQAGILSATITPMGRWPWVRSTITPLR